MKYNYLFLSLVSLSLLSSCSKDSVSDDFDGANGDAAKKLIEQIEFTAEGEENTLTVNYDTNDRVTSVTDGVEIALFSYSNGDLENIDGDGEPFSMDELYQDPYDAFETGDVLEYDQSGNPISISVIDEYYEFVNGEYIMVSEELTATISYDATPNPYFYTIEAAGLIEVMDKVEINFSMMPQSPEIVKARSLFPLNNIKAIVYKDEDGAIVGKLDIDYVYDADNYPTSATFKVTDEDGEISIAQAKYTYK